MLGRFRLYAGFVFCESLFDHRNLRRKMVMACANRILLPLERHPLLQRPNKRSHHVELVSIRGIGRLVRFVARVVLAVVVIVVLLSIGRQVRNLVPLDLADLLARSGFKVCVHWHVPEDVQPDLLVPKRGVDVFDIFRRRDKAGLSDIKAGLFGNLTNRTV